MMRGRRFSPLFVLILAGCAAAVQLTQGGSEVRFLTNPPSDVLTGYAEVGTVTCSSHNMFRRLHTNIVHCQNRLRNEASKLGGTLVVVTSQEIVEKAVTMVGTAYRRTGR